MNPFSVSMELTETIDGQPYYSCIMENGRGTLVEILSFGATIRRWLVPAADGPVDIVQGKDTVAEYKKRVSCSSFIVGRVANRISGAEFTAAGKQYHTEKNDHGINTLHSGSGNYAAKNWTMRPFLKPDAACVEMTLKDHGEGGFPGEADVQVVYSLDEEGSLSLDYCFVPTEETPVNLTCHAYFNLNGHETDSLADHLVMIHASHYLPNDPTGLPDGTIAPVEGTAMDLRSFTELEPALASDFPQLKTIGGYDNNYCIDGSGMRCAASAVGQKTGIRLDVYSDLPGLQFYTTNIAQDNPAAGKDGILYHRHSAFCYETQFYPNAVNEPAFEGRVVKPGEVFRTRTEFRIR